MALKKMCAKCQTIIDYGNTYCDRCSKSKYKDYNQNKRDKESQKFYNSLAWKSIVKVVRLRDKGLCLNCLSNNKISYYDVVHHIEELKENRDKGLDIDNLICLCHSCHAKIHADYKVDKVEVQNKLKDIVGAMKKFRVGERKA